MVLKDEIYILYDNKCFVGQYHYPLEKYVGQEEKV